MAEHSKSMQTAAPAARILVGAPASGGGKTTFACGLMRALMRRGLSVAACKCGPDYIDPMFHSEVIGAQSRNLDLFFSDADQMRALVADSAAASDIVVIEGAMGYYDGLAVSSEASCWDVARATCTPAVLVVDGRGRARSIAAEVHGFATFRQDSGIAGVVLNRISAGMYPRLKELVEQETGIPVYGYVPVLEDASLESRHLGLVTAAEVTDLRAKLDAIADTMEQTVDIDGLLALAQAAAPLAADARPFARVQPVCGAPRIAVARDDAFCFYYADTLRLLRELGAQLVEFSPLADAGLPAGTSGLYLGGGYPELHACELAENEPMRRAVAAAIGAGMPTVAECGGFLYLHEQLEDEVGRTWPMVGVVPGRAYKTQRLGRFGYIAMTAAEDGLLGRAGTRLKAHEFHYWESENPGSAFHAQKPQSARAWDCCIATSTLYAGFPHLYFPSAPQAARAFVEACAAYAGASGSEGLVPNA